MKKFLLFPIIMMASIVGFTQGSIDEKIEEGIALHDKQEYEAAVKKYDEVLAIDSNHFMANYEKAFSLSMLHKYDQTVAICEKINRLYPFEPELKNVYVVWGSALDYMKRPNESIEVYNQGLIEFPDFYLLHFNKAITYAQMGNEALSLKAAQEALKKNGLHGSSHNLVGTIMLRQNKVPSLLASLTLLAIEPTTARAANNLKQVENILIGNVTKGEGNKINVNIDLNFLDTTKNRPDNFTMAELMHGLGSALDHDDKYKFETKPARLSRKLNDLISTMWESRKDGKGFFWEFYIPFFRSMQDNKLVDVYSHIAYASTKDEDNMEWLDKNEAEVERFYGWLKEYF